MPKSPLQKILLILILVILIPPLLLVVKGPRAYKMAKRFAYRLMHRYRPVPHPMHMWKDK